MKQRATIFFLKIVFLSARWAKETIAKKRQATKRGALKNEK